MKATALVTLCLVATVPVMAHEWRRHEDPHRVALQPLTLAEAESIAETTRAIPLAAAGPANTTSAKNTPSAPSGGASFESGFAPFAPKVRTRSDARWIYIESDGLPAHPVMVGITAWQQQVPLPQPYTGDNAWRIPLHPTPAKTPASIRNHFLRGAIALSAIGIPIFNPQNNRGEVSQEIGELDQWGRHCGRADDSQYEVSGETRFIHYSLTDAKTARFDYVEGRGQETTETYLQQSRGGGGGDRPPRRIDGNGGRRKSPVQGGPRPEGGRPAGDRGEARPAGEGGSSVVAENLTPKRSGNFTLRSSAVADGGTLPVEFTGDGSSSTLPLEWTGAPTGTKSFAVIMHHIDPEGKAK